MKKLLTILLFSLLLPNVTNNGAEVTIAEDVIVTVTGDLILNSGNIDISGDLYVLGDILENGGTISGTGYLNDSSLNLGDVYFDGSIDISDIVLLISIIVNGLEFNPLGDVNEDGGLNILDVVALIDIVLNN
ncbi:hypothetical protein N9597_00125 [Candidatus Marinimicrobia bacterium]|nr:hypothetical protein [Candidatus Neomarinimicrobiota bacterium]